MENKLVSQLVHDISLNDHCIFQIVCKNMNHFELESAKTGSTANHDCIFGSCFPTDSEFDSFKSLCNLEISSVTGKFKTFKKNLDPRQFATKLRNFNTQVPFEDGISVPKQHLLNTTFFKNSFSIPIIYLFLSKKTSVNLCNIPVVFQFTGNRKWATTLNQQQLEKKITKCFQSNSDIVIWFVDRQFENNLHSNLILFYPKTKEIIFFEPFGDLFSEDAIQSFEQLIQTDESFQQIRKFKINRTNQHCLRGIQLQLGERDQSFCVYISVLCLYINLINNHLTFNETKNELQKLTAYQLHYMLAELLFDLFEFTFDSYASFYVQMQKIDKQCLRIHHVVEHDEKPMRSIQDIIDLKNDSIIQTIQTIALVLCFFDTYRIPKQELQLKIHILNQLGVIIQTWIPALKDIVDTLPLPMQMFAIEMIHPFWMHEFKEASENYTPTQYIANLAFAVTLSSNLKETTRLFELRKYLDEQMDGNRFDPTYTPEIVGHLLKADVTITEDENQHVWTNLRLMMNWLKRSI